MITLTVNSAIFFPSIARVELNSVSLQNYSLTLKKQKLEFVWHVPLIKRCHGRPNLWTVNVCKFETTIVSQKRTHTEYVSLCVGSPLLLCNINTYVKFFWEKSTTCKQVKFEGSLREGILTCQMTKYADLLCPLIGIMYVFLLVIIKKLINACKRSQIKRKIFPGKLQLCTFGN